eukprot:gnl/Spiro4/13273_TR7049_c0_g1_i2.p1 gnl/Spiro4/13273_TR7049_c0_g1~~gnl/Spiro4/13273_TR7049_c0_g1_i2.p1  ORF type:complete len:145 (+),score=12.05 gnl/Spiro4/13273_TR7049_c0_g1_i2:241-675(+)
MLGLPDNAHLLLLNRSLDEAIKGNRLRDVQRLVAEGADLDSTDSSVYGRTPLHWACCQNADPSIAIFLLERGADPNALDEYGESPLFYACRYGHADLVRALIECGADVNLSNKWSSAFCPRKKKPWSTCFSTRGDPHSRRSLRL